MNSQSSKLTYFVKSLILAVWCSPESTSGTKTRTLFLSYILLSETVPFLKIYEAVITNQIELLHSE